MHKRSEFKQDVPWYLKVSFDVLKCATCECAKRPQMSYDVLRCATGNCTKGRNSNSIPDCVKGVPHERTELRTDVPRVENGALQFLFSVQLPLTLFLQSHSEWVASPGPSYIGAKRGKVGVGQEKWDRRFETDFSLAVFFQDNKSQVCRTRALFCRQHEHCHKERGPHSMEQKVLTLKLFVFIL